MEAPRSEHWSEAVRKHFVAVAGCIGFFHMLTIQCEIVWVKMLGLEVSMRDDS